MVLLAYVLTIIPSPLDGTILQYSAVQMCSVQMMESAMMGCGGPTVHACQVLQAAGKLHKKMNIKLSL